MLIITEDLQIATRGVNAFFRSQINFAASVALNNTAFKVREQIVERTWSAAFTVRNRAFPGRIFRVTKKARKNELSAMLGTTLDREWIHRQATGGTKTGHSGARVAVPAVPGQLRAPNGRIRKNLKPGAIQSRKGVVVVGKTGGRQFIIDRKKKQLLYSIVPSAKINKRFRFYEDAMSTSVAEFDQQFSTAIVAAIRSSRFYTSG